MITKNDCLSILVGLENKGINIDAYMRKLLVSKDIPIDVLKFIAQNKGIEVCNFYEMLRVKHNKNKSPLYTNILKETSDENKIITTLTSFLQQITLYNSKLESVMEKSRFIKEVRAEEVTRVLNSYFKTGELEKCSTELSLIKRDILVLEYLNDRRELS